MIRAVLAAGRQFGDSLHRQMMAMFRQYIVVGGMPQAVAEFASSHELESVDKVKREILGIYRQDIHKFGGRFSMSAFLSFPAAASRDRTRGRRQAAAV